VRLGGKRRHSVVNKKPRVLVVDDERVICDLLHADLTERGYQCTTVLSGHDALIQLAIEDFDAVLLDIRLPGMSGIEVLRETWLNHSKTAVIMITGVNDVDTAVEAMKLGASDYIVKPFKLDRVDASIRTALDAKQTTDKASSEMDILARGVEKKVESITHYAWIVTQRTVNVARQLGIAEEEIQRWVAARTTLDSDNEGMVKCLLDRVRRSPLAKHMTGVAAPYKSKPRSGEPLD